MNINEKLKYYKSASGLEKKRKKQISPSLIALRDYFDAEMPAGDSPYLFIEKIYNLQDPIKGVLKKNSLNFHLLSKKQIGKTDTSQCLFFDLETTGLMGGTGTFAFLMGFGFFKDERFYVHQYFLPDYGMESRLFERLQKFYGEKEFLVSYNGKSFDLPLLNTRFTMNRFPLIFSEMQHLDLLHLARRLWKNSYDSCNLTTIEENILNRFRENDIPGVFIPQAYFDFLHSGRINEIIKIIEHNYWDIVSLAELFLIIGNIEDHFYELKDRTVLLRIAQLAYDQKSPILHRLNEKLGDFDAYHYLLACDYKRAGHRDKAADYWRRLTKSEKFNFTALEELAKYHEHMTKNYKKAMEYALKAIKNLQIMGEFGRQIQLEDEALSLQRRVNRLKKKMS